VADGHVYVGTENGVLHVRDAGTLAADWTYSCGSGESIWGSPIVYDGAAFFGVVIGNPSVDMAWLHTVDLTTRDDRTESPAQTRYGVHYPTPAINTDTGFETGPRCYVGDESCYVTAADCVDGELQWWWTNDHGTIYASPVIYGGYVFVPDSNIVYRLTDGDSAVDHFELFSAGASIDSTPAAYDGYLYFGCRDGCLYCVDASTLTLEWRTDLGFNITGSPVVSSRTRTLYIATDHALVRALDISNGSIEWSYDIRQEKPNAEIKSSPCASGRQLFIVAGDANGRYLYCFGPP
jgi:outer membrane protein assembly factor BamB